MEVNNSNTSYLASYATDIETGDVKNQIAMEVVKQIKESGERQALSLIKMVNQTTEQVVKDGHVDTYA